MENEKQRRTISPIILFAILIQIVFLITLVSIIINNIINNNKIEDRNNQPKISLDDSLLKSINLPNDYIEDISHSLTDIIELNTDGLNTSNSNALIRKDTVKLKEFSNHSFNALSFIVDIPNLEQSYQIYYKYPSNLEENDPFFNNPRAVLCLDEKSQIVYPDFKCTSSLPSNTRYRIIVDYINFLEFDEFTISIDDNNPYQININPIIDTNDANYESYILQVKSDISSLGVSPDLFSYHLIKKQDLNYIID